MPALRSFSAKFLRDLHDAIAPSIVQLAVYSEIDYWYDTYEDKVETSQLGTGIILSRTPDRIGIITSIDCDSMCKVVARFGDQMYLEAKVMWKSGLLYGLVIRGKDLDAVPCTPAKFYEGELVPSGPTFVVGCQDTTKHQIVVSGMISVEEFKDKVRNVDVFTFVHTSPIGDGLIGAPVLNQAGDILGINVARTSKTAKINYALKNSELRKMLAGLVGTEFKLETKMGELIELFSQKISNSELPARSHLKKRKGTTIDSGADQCKHRK